MFDILTDKYYIITVFSFCHHSVTKSKAQKELKHRLIIPTERYVFQSLIVKHKFTFVIWIIRKIDSWRRLLKRKS